MSETKPSGIPKILHYCWFGGNPLPEKAAANIAHWQELMPEYEIQRWDESNFDVDECRFVRGAYDAKKWAFVSDYARFKVLYDNGGVYMDIGSELLKSIDPLVEQSGFTALDWQVKTVAPGLVLAAGGHHHLLGETLEEYRALEFEDTKEFLYGHTVNLMLEKVLNRYGFQRGADALWEYEDFRVYPSEYFCPKLDFGGFKCTENTYSTHVSTASWVPAGERYRNAFINKWAPRVGDFAARKTARILTLLKFRKDER